MPLKRGNDLVKRLYRKEGNNTQEVMELKDTNGNLIHKRVGVILHLDGSVYSEETYTWGVDSIQNPGTPRLPMPGEEFKGWYIGSASNIITFPYFLENPSTYLIYALYQPQVFTVTYVRDWDGSVITTREVEFGQNATRPDLISVDFGEGYVYDGYTGVYTSITSNRTIRIKRKAAITATPNIIPQECHQIHYSMFGFTVITAVYKVKNNDSQAATVYHQAPVGNEYPSSWKSVVLEPGELSENFHIQPLPSQHNIIAEAQADGMGRSDSIRMVYSAGITCTVENF